MIDGNGGFLMSFKQLLLYASIAAFSMGSMHASEKFMPGSFAHFNAPNLQEHFGANQQFVPVMMVPANMMNLGQMAHRPSWSIANHLTFNNLKNIAIIGAVCGTGYLAYNYLYGKDLAAIKGMLHKATQSTKSFISTKFDDFKQWVTEKVTKRIDDVSKDVKTVESKVDSIAAQQNTLDGKIGTVDSKVDNVNSRLDTVATQQTTVMQAQERLEAGQSRLEKAQTQLRDDMEAKFASLLEAFKKLATTTDENGTKTITENKLAIEEAKKQILAEIAALIQKTNGENTALLLAQFKILIEQINSKKQE